MAGLNCATPSRIAWQLVSRGIDVYVAVEDERVPEAMRLLARDGIVAGVQAECFGTPSFAESNMGPRYSNIGAAQALVRAGVKKLVVASLTALYGAKQNHPALLREDAPLAGCPVSRFFNDKVQVEEQLADRRLDRDVERRQRLVA